MVPLYSLSIKHVLSNFDRVCFIDFSILSVNCSHVCIIYVQIYEKISSGGFEVLFSFYMYKLYILMVHKLVIYCVFKHGR